MASSASCLGKQGGRAPQKLSSAFGTSDSYAIGTGKPRAHDHVYPWLASAACLQIRSVHQQLACGLTEAVFRECAIGNGLKTRTLLLPFYICFLESVLSLSLSIAFATRSLRFSFCSSLSMCSYGMLD